MGQPSESGPAGNRRLPSWYVPLFAAVGIFLLPFILRDSAAQTPSGSPSKAVDFNRDIRPILSDTCFTCHGPDEASRMGNLRLDTPQGPENPYLARDGYHILVPGKSSESRLYQKISAQDETERMPPSFSNRHLTPKQIELIREWIDQGARWETHWAFVPPRRPELPQVAEAGWPRNPIDNFILARLESEGLRPAHEAGKVTLLRRVTLDLTGLPPTPAEVRAFLADPSPDAYEKRVDALLQSPHYGERMAMEWLDLARYSDTHGYHIDSQRDMWAWRDWVIGAFNSNMPFDRFTIEQIAGDLLPNATRDQKIATGFNRNHMINFEGGAIPAEYHNEYVVDRVEATSAAWMALTMGCARCHDHKFDPIRQKDFYRFYAFFNSVPEKGLDGIKGNADPVLQLPSPDQARLRAELKAKIATLTERISDKTIRSLQSSWEKDALATIPRPAREGLLAHYEFEGHLADTSGHYHHGRTRRSQVAFGGGPVGRSADFNGQAELDLGDAGEFDSALPFSLNFWFNPGAKYAMPLLRKVDESEEHRGLEITLDEAQVVGIQKRAAHLTVRLIHRLPDEQVEIRTKERVLSAWHHLSVNYDGSGKAAGLTLRIDGKPRDVEILHDRLTGAARNHSPLEIGNLKGTSPFKGQIDDLRIYDRQLSPDDIEQLAVHEPIRALLGAPSEACAEMAASEKSAGTPEPPADPLIEQGQVDTRAYRIKEQCLGEQAKVRDYFLTWAAPEESRQQFRDLKALKEKLEELDNAIPTTMVMEEMSEPRKTFVLARGDYRNKGEEVEPGVPAVLPPLPKDAPRNRLGLAEWLVSPSHPLTARVAVNHFWQMYFGTGLVKTAENFGSQGEPPSHPELLDWLATEFVRTGWNIKAMQRLMVTSSTYRQSSRASRELIERDPENRLLARGPRFRLPAEVIRDNALAASGLLNGEIGGPSVFPYQPKGLWEEMAFGEGFSAQTYTPSHGKDLYRRSLYTFWKRTVPPPSLVTFDAPDREKCTARRLLTNTPLQALVLMNDPTYVEAARALAQRTLQEAGTATAQRVRYAFLLATAREPGREELRLLQRLAREQLSHYRRDREAAAKLIETGESVFDPRLNPAELAAWTTVASAILNLDETITKE